MISGINKEARWLYAELIKSYISFHSTSQLLKEPFYIQEPFYIKEPFYVKEPIYVKVLF